MTRTLIRARLLTFHREPQTPDDTGAFTYIEDGALLVEGGMIRAMGEASAITAPDAKLIDHPPALANAGGFIDTHLHFPQTQVIASWAAELLDWLNDYTFPEETRYADPALCEEMAARFLDRLTDHGTTTAVAYASVHASSVEALFAEAFNRDMRLMTGKVMMDRNAPDALCDTPQSSYDDSKALIARWQRGGPLGLCDHAALRHHLYLRANGSRAGLGRRAPRLPHPDPSKRKPRRDCVVLPAIPTGQGLHRHLRPLRPAAAAIACWATAST